MKTIFLILYIITLPLTAKFKWQDYYKIESLPLPQGVDPQIGGIDILADGRLIACFHRGEVMTYDPITTTWKLFASGLHEPLGIYADDDGTVYVVQRGELTALIDTNNDGVAEHYKTISDEWGLSGNYHEFAFGLVKDSSGNLYVGLGTASNGSGVREEIRGKWNDAGGLSQDKFTYTNSKEWGMKKDNVPRMYARVPYRGCILKINPKTRTSEVYATGTRTPNGLYIDNNDQLWVSDNQGDWVGASKLHRIEEGKFHGHAASLLWGKNPVTDAIPAKLPLAELNARRVKAPYLLPQGDCGNSITQPLPMLNSFAPVINNNLILIGEMNHSRLPLFYPDKVNGQHQGAVSHFMNTAGLGTGNNRMAYAPDGKSLYIGKTHLGWPGAEGFRRITYNGKPFLQVQNFKLHPKGFQLSFNAHVKNAKHLAGYKIQSYKIAYHDRYGSPKLNRVDEEVIHVNNTGKEIIITLKDAPKANRVYDITLTPKLHSEELGSLSSYRYWYTAHEAHPRKE